MERKALIVWGGWDGHQPKEVAAIFARLLEAEKFSVEVRDSLDAFNDGAKLKSLSLIVPVWTMGTIGEEQLKNVCAAVRGGVGIAGCHGGMCDSFRAATEWQFMTGGQWVAHPGNDGVEYTVKITGGENPITAGISDFKVRSEQYYMHVDPAVNVLATTRFPTADGPHVGNGPVDMPVVWTKVYGQGRVYYNSLGHQANIVSMPPVLELMRRGFLWAASGGSHAH
ncbi:MAG TPA: ThuA domain-containing protein [Tepidisphaeraceae bacterium]|nr:ThuA domain-containing protein [Tepidisphaeraceae bacterium]